MQIKLLLLMPVLAISCAAAEEIISRDICIYGGTAAGVAAGLQAARMGTRAVIVESGDHLGGMTSGGLGATDIGNKRAIGGIAREFYQHVAGHYANETSWKFETAAEYFKNSVGRGTRQDLQVAGGTMWTFEPHVAEGILFGLVNEAGVAVYFQQQLEGVMRDGVRIRQMRMRNGKIFRARMFIDATYEGDLMAKAGVSYTVGREANSIYRETLNGVRAETPKHQFEVAVDPYRRTGDAQSGLVPLVQRGEPAARDGTGDRAVQAYNFRLCYTQNPRNRAPHTPPPKYDPAEYELLARYLEALVKAGREPGLDQLWHPIRMPNGKTDINNNGPISTDFIGANYEYPQADPVKRAEIRQQHEDYTRGFVYFLATDLRVPERVRREMQTWGPAKDEFFDTGNWPHQLYVREARRMISDYVMSEHNCRGEIRADDSVGLAAYTMDSHNCRRIVNHDRVQNEGDVQVGGFPPYPISYRSLIPKSGECENLLVPVCLSATHIAYGSIRMEPVFMILGQSAATAAVLALERNQPLQKLRYGPLRARLLRDQQVLEWAAAKAE